jgi:hypothetical protein
MPPYGSVSRNRDATLPLMPEAPIPSPHPWDEDADHDARFFLWVMIRDVYRRAVKPNTSTPPLLTDDGIAELRGAVRCLRQFGQLSQRSATELLAPVVGDDIVEEWFTHTWKIIKG